MKKIFNFLLSSIALIAFIPALNAQPYTEGTGDAKGIAYSKTITGPDNGIYTISLESFVTGSITIKQGVPADIVLVLDVSGSMDYSYGHDEYEALTSAGYSYDSYGDSEYYVYYNNNYYLVSRYRSNNNSNTRYRLRFTANNRTYYLSGTSITSNRAGAANETDIIWTGVLYKKTQSATTRIAALKKAVGEFIDVIKANAEESVMDNKISIVKFAMNSFPSGDSATAYTVGDNDYYYNQNVTNANYTQVVADWTSVTSGATDLKRAVNDLHAAGATAVDYGLNRAQLLLSQSAVNRESAKTVVVFTDGSPTYQSDFDNTVANNAIGYAKDIKAVKAFTDDNGEDHYTTIYTVGVFDTETSDITKYMNYVSSNYPGAESMGQDPAPAGGDNGFYQNAEGGDLSSIFRDIATASGGAGASLDASTVETIDVVSASFELPDGANTDITVKFVPCIDKGSDGYLIFDDANWEPNPAEGEEDHVAISIDGNKVTANGFDFTKNWCGLDESIGRYRGYKMVLEIPIEMSDDAVGGQGVDTNGPGSGIFINGSTTPILAFESPDVSLPTNIHIKKEGLSSGESAVFKIYRTAANADGTPANSNWTYYKTVIIIEGMNEDSTVKLRGLDPNYAYKIEEAGWSWAYDTTNPEGEDGNPLTEVTSDKLITNPFTFTNTLNTKGQTIIRAESAVVNDFKTSTATNIDSKNTAPKAQSSKGKK